MQGLLTFNGISLLLEKKERMNAPKLPLEPHFPRPVWDEKSYSLFLKCYEALPREHRRRCADLPPPSHSFTHRALKMLLMWR